ncbi:MAG TPA: phosphoglyceromutase, partial [Chryseosolibacter sp.]|nr:phosphoglyceromutase [Chryseosolibacter sp.]
MLKLVSVLVILAGGSYAQEVRTRNLVIVTLDGYRWSELFQGADPAILGNARYITDTSAASSYNGPDAKSRRERLMPFMWGVIAREGQLYGNRKFNNKVNCTNNHLLSYPGYSEMFVGFPDRTVSSNERKTNPNATVLEFIHRHQGFHEKVVAFGTWDMFPYIFREQQANLYVNAGRETAKGVLSTSEKSANEQLGQGRRTDEHTFIYAFEYLKRERPRVLFIGFDGTDH